MEKWKIRNGFCISAGLAAVAPATFILNRPGWYKDKILASGFPVLVVGSTFIVVAMITQVCERINEKMVPLNRIILMAIGGLCILAASIVFTTVVFVGIKRDEYAIVRATATYCWLALLLDIVYIVLSIVWPQDDAEQILSQRLQASNRVLNNAGNNLLIDANAQAPVVTGSSMPPCSQQSATNKRNTGSDKSIGYSERSSQRDANGSRRIYRSDRHSYRSGGRSLRSGRQSQRSANRRVVPTGGTA